MARLRNKDILDLMALIQDLDAPAAQPLVRHERMLARLSTILGASCAVSMLVRISPAEKRRTSPLMLITHGWNDEKRRRIANDYWRSLTPTNPARAPLLQHLIPGDSRPVTMLRHELVGDAEWYASAYVIKRHRPMGIDHALFSVQSMEAGGLISAIKFFRPWGDRKPFGERERRILRLFHSQAQWLYRFTSPGRLKLATTLPAERKPAFSLSPRQWETLQHLLRGDSEKQIALKLQLSRHTIHEHVKAIYRNVGVNSRGALLAKFLVNET